MRKWRGMVAPPTVQSKLRRLHHLLHPFCHIRRRYIFHVSSNAPEVSEWILNEAIAVSVELVLHRLQDFRSLGRRFLDHAINVGKVDIEAHWATANSGGTGVSLPHAWIFVCQHDVRVADFQLGVTDLAVRAVHANSFRRPKNFLEI